MNTLNLPLLPLILGRVPAGLRQALSQEGVPFLDELPGPPAGRFLLYDSSAEPYRHTPLGQVGIDVQELAEGFPEDPFAALLDEQTATCHWQAEAWLVQEEVARVDKRRVRQSL